MKVNQAVKCWSWSFYLWSQKLEPPPAKLLSVLGFWGKGLESTFHIWFTLHYQCISSSILRGSEKNITKSRTHHEELKIPYTSTFLSYIFEWVIVIGAILVSGHSGRTTTLWIAKRNLLKIYFMKLFKSFFNLSNMMLVAVSQEASWLLVNYKGSWFI